MAVAVFLRWEGFTPEQYEAARELVPFDRESAPGGLVHVAAFDENGIRVSDVWESEEHFQNYLANFLGPAFGQLGFTGQPEMEIVPVHTFLTPGVDCS